MKYVLDASVAVAATRPREPTHAPAQQRVARILAGHDSIVVPVLFSVEVAAALSRTGSPASTIGEYVDSLLAPPTVVVSLGVARARRVRAVAIRARLRSADAFYVWLAAREGLPLVTSDREIFERAGTIAYASTRTHRRQPPATFRASYRPQGDRLAIGSLETFLHER